MPPFAIYFPQFYPTPTNDRVWGKGFTDWTLLANANVRLPDAERRAPARGLYDGSDPAVHRAQIAEMQAFGLGGIGLYHYWFYTHQELDAFERSLSASHDQSAMPWFLIWATEGWTKRWLGDHTTILALDPDPDDASIETHCRHLAQCFANPAYYRWHGRPLFVWYNLGHFARPGHVVDRYRAALQRNGHDVAMANFVKGPADIDLCAHTDATYVFEPRMFFNFGRSDRGKAAKFAYDKAIRLIGRDNADRLLVGLERRHNGAGRLLSAEAFMAYLQSDARAEALRGIGHGFQNIVSPGWDNRPRYRDGGFTALAPMSASQFEAQLASTTATTRDLPVLINAWNEWTETAAIEPCAYLGTRYVDTIANV